MQQTTQKMKREKHREIKIPDLEKHTKNTHTKDRDFSRFFYASYRGEKKIFNIGKHKVQA